MLGASFGGGSVVVGSGSCSFCAAISAAAPAARVTSRGFVIRV